MTESDPESADDLEAQRAVTERIEREEFARGNIAEDEAPARPRDAATIVLARATADPGFEVLLLKRPSTSRFAAGRLRVPRRKDRRGRRRPRASRRACRRPAATRSRRRCWPPCASCSRRRACCSPTGGRRRRARGRRRAAPCSPTSGRSARWPASTTSSFNETHVCYFARWITPCPLRPALRHPVLPGRAPGRPPRFRARSHRRDRRIDLGHTRPGPSSCSAPAACRCCSRPASRCRRCRSSRRSRRCSSATPTHRRRTGDAAAADPRRFDPAGPAGRPGVRRSRWLRPAAPSAPSAGNGRPTCRSSGPTTPRR